MGADLSHKLRTNVYSSVEVRKNEMPETVENDFIVVFLVGLFGMSLMNAYVLNEITEESMA